MSYPRDSTSPPRRGLALDHAVPPHYCTWLLNFISATHERGKGAKEIVFQRTTKNNTRNKTRCSHSLKKCFLFKVKAYKHHKHLLTQVSLSDSLRRISRVAEELDKQVTRILFTTEPTQHSKFVIVLFIVTNELNNPLSSWRQLLMFIFFFFFFFSRFTKLFQGFSFNSLVLQHDLQSAIYPFDKIPSIVSFKLLVNYHFCWKSVTNFECFKKCRLTLRVFVGRRETDVHSEALQVNNSINRLGYELPS
jgi:hypothetical protein